MLKSVLLLIIEEDMCGLLHVPFSYRKKECQHSYTQVFRSHTSNKLEGILREELQREEQGNHK